MITVEPGAVIAGRYTLTSLLGRGGMGSVWLARHRDLGIDVAVKLMAPALVASPDARMRFEREARIVAPLGSQNVVRIHDYGVEDGTPYIIMEVLKGESLATRLAGHLRVSPAVAARLLAPICKALGAAHEAGVVHRDLKPANIFLALEGRDEVVKVLDFGIAKSAGTGEVGSETATGMMLGSAQYMSPEQIRSSKQVDHRSDLWSVGIILYRMLTGRLPFVGIDVGDVLVRVCTEVYPVPSTLAAELSADIDAFFERALARLPGQRFQSAMELSAAFDAAALNARRPAATPGLERLTSTIAMKPAAARASEGPRDSAPTEEWKPAPAPKMVDGADPLAPAPGLPDVNPASISAVLVAGRNVGSLPTIAAPRAEQANPFRRALLPSSVAAMVVTFALVLATAMIHPTGPTVVAAQIVAPPSPPATSASAEAVVAATSATPGDHTDPAPVPAVVSTAPTAVVKPWIMPPPGPRPPPPPPPTTSVAPPPKPPGNPLDNAK
ncbi:MAG: protein kinase [Byssovorax sp.]